ncbi:MAG: hypothetical protein RBS27_11605 [Giesbergeria sp.]|nr:hypothetical protein [Giesbergeria sp.]
MTLGAPANAVSAGAMVFSLPTGHVLTQDNIHLLHRHKVEFVVVSVPDPRTEEQIARDRKDTAARIRQIFAGANLSDPCTAALFDQVLAYRST